MDLDPAPVLQLSGVALACDKLIRSVDFELFPAAKSSPCDEREEPDNVVTTLHSLVTAVKSQAKFVSSDSYLLEIRKCDWKLVEDLAFSLLEKHHCSPLPIPRFTGHVHEESVGGNLLDWPSSVEANLVSGEQEALHINEEHMQVLPTPTVDFRETTFQVEEFKSWSLSTLQSISLPSFSESVSSSSHGMNTPEKLDKATSMSKSIYSLNNLRALEKLNFIKCQLWKHVPEGFANLSCLKTPYIRKCEALEEDRYGLGNLKELFIHKCRSLKQVLEGFGNLTRLKKLDMSECEALEEFPFGLSNLIALDEFSFHKCLYLKHLPKGFGNLTGLKKLDMWECEVFEEFPFGLSNLIALEELSFHKC